MSANGSLDSGAVIADLRELAELTGNEHGAQRVAWGPTWRTAREWLQGRLNDLPLEVELDEAGNLWASAGDPEGPHLALGSHLDSVPDGGWLDGTLGTLAALHVVKALLDEGFNGRVSLIDWVDEEGRFGRALLGSGLATGAVDPQEVADLRDRDGIGLVEQLAENGVVLAEAARAGSRVAALDAYLELHIEQGPVLEDLDLPLAAVTGAAGLERHRADFSGQAAHAGSTPMALRRDAMIGAARLAVEMRDRARGSEPPVLATCGQVFAEPNIATAIAGRCSMSFDVRSADAQALTAAWKELQDSAERIAAEEGLDLDWQLLQKIAPIHFDSDLVSICARAVADVTGQEAPRLTSGPLHDACMVALSGVPAAMLFVRSLGGISHAKEEDSREEDLRQGVEALHRAARAWLDEKD